jgi:small subunit ribosomal protein S5e
MSDAGDIEVENVESYNILPKEVAEDLGTVKLFGRWDYDVEVRDISLTYAISAKSRKTFDIWSVVASLTAWENVQ